MSELLPDTLPARFSKSIDKEFIIDIFVEMYEKVPNKPETVEQYRAMYAPIQEALDSEYSVTDEARALANEYLTKAAQAHPELHQVMLFDDPRVTYEALQTTGAFVAEAVLTDRQYIGTEVDQHPLYMAADMAHTTAKTRLTQYVELSRDADRE